MKGSVSCFHHTLGHPTKFLILALANGQLKLQTGKDTFSSTTKDEIVVMNAAISNFKQSYLKKWKEGNIRTEKKKIKTIVFSHTHIFWH